ncbi:MAG TPA: type II toxin-antitoxin system prevent-host-death family antitoxin [Terrimesophilobacter sp.]|nr:type II toxin-antitoxin system prevent-host-death family antitoxin [Terrimesophilobacter sp.]
MSDVTVRELRNHGGEVLDRVERGESLTVTRSGKPVAELRAITRPGLTAAQLLERWRNLPDVDPGALRADIDTVLDASL